MNLYKRYLKIITDRGFIPFKKSLFKVENEKYYKILTKEYCIFFQVLCITFEDIVFFKYESYPLQYKSSSKYFNSYIDFKQILEIVEITEQQWHSMSTKTVCFDYLAKYLDTDLEL